MAKTDVIKRIFILADGTGNAFSKQESNVWRLFEALDLTRPGQVAYYIEGVGTSGFRPFAILDGATGVGVPSNVRKLYRFLCWNWRPGVEIYMFGFSRGAFTVRTLVGMIASQGLLPNTFERRSDTSQAEWREAKTGPVSREEMKRNTREAWRRYRAESVPFSKVLPTVSAARLIRNVLLTILRMLRRDRPFGEIQAERDRQERRDVDIHFLGLFDTVEAYGVPINELRGAIDWAIWPMSFRNLILSSKVDRARHALCLDDERTTFHPVQFQMTEADRAGQKPRIREVWFAGMHSDVGGGYPDDDLAYVPLDWMVKETIDAAGTADPPIFRADRIAAIESRASPLAQSHDSRAGLGALYRYGPRCIESKRVRNRVGQPGSDPGAEARSDLPIIHHAVAEKMVFGTENYAPLTLPHRANVLMNDGTLKSLEGFEPEAHRRFGPAVETEADVKEDVAQQAIARLIKPNADYVDLTRDTIWWRRIGYFALLAAFLLAASLPWTAASLNQKLTVSLIPLVSRLLSVHGLESWQRYVDDAQNGLASDLRDWSASIGGLVPSYAQGWLRAIVEQPLVSGFVLALVLTFYRLNGFLRDRIADNARCAWFIGSADPQLKAPRSLWSYVARPIRTSRLVNLVAGWFSRIALPGLALVAFAIGVLVLVERSTLSYRTGAGAFCWASEAGAATAPQEGIATISQSTFETNNPCWRSGIWVEKGRSYTLWLDMVDDYRDGKALVGIDGFTSSAGRYLVGALVRRWWSGDWYQPVGRIGQSGNVEWLLQSADGHVAPPLTTKNSARDASVLRRAFTAQFTANGSGEFFLFVNDALPVLPLLPTDYAYYLNNAGTAKVTLELMPLPQKPQIATTLRAAGAK